MKYKHPTSPPENRYELLKYWIVERQQIFHRRNAGKPKPWTQDPILQQYKFCNVYREWDTVTQWIAKHWRKPHARDGDLWLAMVVARLVNWPETLAGLLAPVGLHKQQAWAAWGEHFVGVLQGRKARGDKVFSGAYIVSTNGHKQDKAEYLLEHVLTPLWQDRGIIRPTMEGTTLAQFGAKLLEYDGLGGFMAGQVIADVKQEFGQELHRSHDYGTFAFSGPGSRRGMNRLKSRLTDAPWVEREWHNLLCELRVNINHELYDVLASPLCCQDLQNCLCEYDKYMRVLLGEGRPRSLYKGV